MHGLEMHLMFCYNDFGFAAKKKKTLARIDFLQVTQVGRCEPFLDFVRYIRAKLRAVARAISKRFYPSNCGLSRVISKRSYSSNSSDPKK